MKTRIFSFLIFVITVTLASCAPLPMPASKTSFSRGNIAPGTMNQIIPGKTDLLAILLKLGQPDSYSQDWVVYEQTDKEPHAWISFLPSDTFICQDQIHNLYRIYVDEDWIVTKLEHETQKTTHCK